MRRTGRSSAGPRRRSAVLAVSFALAALAGCGGSGGDDALRASLVERGFSPAQARCVTDDLEGHLSGGEMERLRSLPWEGLGPGSRQLAADALVACTARG